MDNSDRATLVWMLICAIMTAISMSFWKWYVTVMWFASSLITLYTVKMILERESRKTHVKRTEETQ